MRILVRPKEIVLGLLSLVICLYGISPYSMTNDIIFQFGLIIIVCVTLALFTPNELIRVLFEMKYIYVYIYPAYLFFCFLINRTVLGEAVFSFINTTIPLVFLVLLEGEEKKLIKSNNTIVIVYMSAICIFTLFMLQNNPLICRLLAHYMYWENLSPTELFFTGGFDFIYSVVLVSGVFLYLVKKKTNSSRLKLLFIILYFLCAGTVLASAYTTGILLLCVESLFVFYFSTLNRSPSETILFIIGGLAIVIMMLNLGPLFSLLKTLTDSNEVASRFDDLSKLFSGEGLGSGDVYGRSVVYGYSIDTWVHNFWNGVGYSEYSTLGKNGIGGHSELLDHLGYYGTIGTLFFVLALVKTKKTITQFLDDQDKKIYTLIFVVFIVEYIMNLGYTFTFINTIFFVIPSILFVSNELSRLEDDILIAKSTPGGKL